MDEKFGINIIRHGHEQTCEGGTHYYSNACEPRLDETVEQMCRRLLDNYGVMDFWDRLEIRLFRVEE
jgi:hypothetical protein